MNRNIYISTYEGETLLFNEQTVGLFEDDFLSYNTDNDNIRINLKTFSFTKENMESLLKITEKCCIIKLKKLNQSVEIPLDYINFEFDNNKKVFIEYKLVSQEIPLKIIITIGDENNEI